MPSFVLRRIFRAERALFIKQGAVPVYDRFAGDWGWRLLLALRALLGYQLRYFHAEPPQTAPDSVRFGVKKGERS